MNGWRTIRTMQAGRRVLAFALALGCASALGAQVSSYGDKTAGVNSGEQLPTVLQKVQVTQRLNAQLPMDAQFVAIGKAEETVAKADQYV